MKEGPSSSMTADRNDASECLNSGESHLQQEETAPNTLLPAADVLPENVREELNVLSSEE
jgi:hypothetical protein